MSLCNDQYYTGGLASQPSWYGKNLNVVDFLDAKSMKRAMMSFVIIIIIYIYHALINTLT